MSVSDSDEMVFIDRPNPKKPTALRGAVGVRDCESSDHLKSVASTETQPCLGSVYFSADGSASILPLG
jgi:hypothetical protein